MKSLYLTLALCISGCIILESGGHELHLAFYLIFGFCCGVIGNIVGGD